MEILNEEMVVTVYRPGTTEVFSEHYFNTVNEAMAYFNEMCEARPTSTIEFGVMTICADMVHDAYRVIKVRK